MPLACRPVDPDLVLVGTVERTLIEVVSPVPEEIIRLYDPNPPEDREGLVYKPPADLVPA